MGHADAHAERPRTGRQAVALLQGIHRVGEVVGAVDPEHRHLRAREVDRRVPALQPELRGVRPELLELAEPGAVVAEETAAVNRHGAAKAVVHARDDAREIAAPRDAGEADARGVDLRPRAQQRVREQHVGDGMVRPLVLGRLVRLVPAAPAGGPAKLVARMLAIAWSSAASRTCPSRSRHSRAKSRAAPTRERPCRRRHARGPSPAPSPQPRARGFRGTRTSGSASPPTAASRKRAPPSPPARSPARDRSSALEKGSPSATDSAPRPHRRRKAGTRGRARGRGGRTCREPARKCGAFKCAIRVSWRRWAPIGANLKTRPRDEKERLCEKAGVRSRDG